MVIITLRLNACSTTLQTTQTVAVHSYPSTTAEEEEEPEKESLDGHTNLGRRHLEKQRGRSSGTAIH